MRQSAGWRGTLFQKEVKRMKSLNLTEIYRAVVQLLDSGWSLPGIERLTKLRNRFQHTSEDFPALSVDLLHLEFIRWLVQRGRMTEW